uniref:Mannosyltransferase n=1 Tax=Panagrolaimus sp. ES5 TaxID=591445 RepID=A0AC34G2V4_9BILA
MILGTLSIVIRPTAILIWGLLGIHHLYRSNQRFALLRTAIFSCSLPLLFTVALDSDFHFPLKFPLLSFAQFNFFTGGSAHFGVHPWYWYLVDGLLLTSAGMYIAAIGGYLYQVDRQLPRSPPKILFLTALFYINVHSWLPHKEHRFILPILPLLLPFAGLFLQYMFTKMQKFVQGVILFYVIVNVIAAIFFCKFHQRGVLEATKDIVEDISLRRPSNSIVHIVQLTPCYSMPQYAYFHQLPVEHHMLDCTPNLLNKPNYIDESDLFHADPVKFLYNADNYEEYLLHRHSYVVIYKKTYQKISSILKETGYRIWRKYSHTIMPSSKNQDTVLFVLKRSSNALMK